MKIVSLSPQSPLNFLISKTRIYIFLFGLLSNTLIAQSVWTDKGDYQPGETAYASGSGFQAGEIVELNVHEEPVIHPDVVTNTTADASGNFVNVAIYNFDSTDYGSSFTLTATGQSSGYVATAYFTDGGQDLWSWRNQGSSANSWKSGTTIQSANSIFAEGEVIPFRWTIATGNPAPQLQEGITYVVELDWAYAGGTAAPQKLFIDYLTSYNATEIPPPNVPFGPGSDLGGGFQNGYITTVPIPNDTGDVAPNPPTVAHPAGNFTLYNIDPNSVMFSSYIVDNVNSNQEDRKLRITFKPSDNDATSNEFLNVGIAWGAHLATQADYGQNNGAGDFPGASPQMVVDLNPLASGDQTNLNINPGAIISQGQITIIKDASPNDPEDFGFTITGPSGANITSPFTLDDDADGTLSNQQVFFGLVEGDYTITENSVSGWILTSITPAENGPEDSTAGDISSTNVSAGTTSITLANGENWVVTYLNDKDALPSLTISKTQTSGEDPVTVPGVIGYDIVVTNDGTTSLTNVVVTDLLPDGTAGTVSAATESGTADGILSVGETFTYTVSYTVTQADIDAGTTLVNTASVTTTELPTPEEDTEDTPITQAPSILTNKAFDDIDNGSLTKYTTVDQEINYSITVENTGNVTIKNVIVTDNNADAVPTYVSGDTNDDGIMEVGEIWTYSATHTVTQDDLDAGSVLNIASATGEDPNHDSVDDNSDEVTVNAEQNPSILTEKSFENIDNGVYTVYAAIGQVINYTITLTNNGNVTVYDVTIADDTATTGPTYQSGDIGADGVLEVGEVWTYSATHTVDQADLDAGSYMNIAEGDGSADINGDGQGDTPVEDDDDVTVNEDPCELLVSKTIKHITCNGDNDGAVDITLNGGNQPYTYEWTGPEGFITNTEDLSGLAPGTYILNVIDDNLCSTSVSVVIEEPDLVTLQASATNVSCNGLADGTITVSGVSAGATTIIQLDGVGVDLSGQTTFAPGTYLITASAADGNGNADVCTATAEVTITEPSLLTATAGSQVDVLCFGEVTGSVVITPAGGTAPYTISPAQTDLAAGDYTFTVEDANGCTTTVDVTITQPDAELTVIPTTYVECSAYVVSYLGSINLDVSGGTSPYLYEWSGPENFSADTKDLNDVILGSYNVIVTDNNGCVVNINVELSLPEPIVIQETTVNDSCNEGGSGSIDITVSGGNPPFTFGWTGPGYFSATTEDISDLVAGNYVVTVTDANGCSNSMSVTVNQSSIVIDKVREHVSCYGGNDGSVDITVSGGTPPYTYSWTGPGYFNADTEDISGLVAGTYEVTVTDAYGCTKSRTAPIYQPDDALIASNTVVDTSCQNGTLGSVDVHVSGGTPPYTFVWTGPNDFSANTEDISNLEPGTYVVLITDDNGCTASCSATISQTGEITVDKTIEHVTCYGGNDGSVDITVSGGTSPYTYSWTGPGYFSATTEDIHDVVAGNYVITVTDANGCSVTKTKTVSQPDNEIVVGKDIEHVSCYGSNDGSVDITVSGGTSPYTYSWTGPGYFSATTEDIYDLVPGNYVVTVTDANGCSVTKTKTVSQPDNEIVVGKDIEDVSCPGGSDGSVDITVTGGTEPYTYAWTGPGYFSADTEDLTNLEAGIYEVTVTDANGCSASYEATIYEPAYGSSTALNIKVFLGGPYATGTGTMNYDLSYNGDTPTSCPYIDEATCHTSVFNTSGNDAIVDWVWIEIRDGTDGITVIESKSALIQADGDVVGTDGVSPVSFDVASANYYVMVSHRNHLGVLTANPISITACNVTYVDLTTSIDMIYGGANGAHIAQDGRITMYPGDCNGDGQIQNTDKNEASPLRGLSGYINADVDMNGEVQNSDISSYLNPNIGKGVQAGGSRTANLSLHAKRKEN